MLANAASIADRYTAYRLSAMFAGRASLDGVAQMT